MTISRLIVFTSWPYQKASTGAPSAGSFSFKTDSTAVLSLSHSITVTRTGSPISLGLNQFAKKVAVARPENPVVAISNCVIFLMPRTMTDKKRNEICETEMSFKSPYVLLLSSISLLVRFREVSCRVLTQQWTNLWAVTTESGYIQSWVLVSGHPCSQYQCVRVHRFTSITAFTVVCGKTRARVEPMLTISSPSSNCPSTFLLYVSECTSEIEMLLRIWEHSDSFSPCIGGELSWGAAVFSRYARFKTTL